MDDTELKPGDHIEVLGVITFLNSRGEAYRSAVGECQVYLCERRRQGFWRARVNYIPGDPEVLVHRTAFCERVDGIQTLEVKVDGKPTGCWGYIQ